MPTRREAVRSLAVTGAVLVTSGARDPGAAGQPGPPELLIRGALGRGADPDEIVGTALYFASDASSYTTGAILSHEYFNDWGLDQGFDEYDNEIGRTHDPWRVSANRVTDRALAWIARHPGGRWFLWTHFLDRHAQYVAHPGEVSWGDGPEDLYDGELRWTDTQIGRLLDELLRLPGGDRTIVVITSDHGDAFGEHGFSGHAIALSKELIGIAGTRQLAGGREHYVYECSSV